MDYFPDQLKDLINEAWHQVTVLFECTMMTCLVRKSFLKSTSLNLLFRSLEVTRFYIFQLLEALNLMAVSFKK